MIDAIIAVAVQHYVIFGLGALAVGIVLNLLITAGPEIVRELRITKLF